MNFVKKILIKLKIIFVKIIGYNTFFRYKYFKINRRHQKALKRVRKKKKYKICFLLIMDSVWKYDVLYKLFENDNRFNPMILVCPYWGYGEENMLFELDRTFNKFKEKGYNVINSLKTDGSWLSIKDDIKPDVIFFTTAYNYTNPEYCIRQLSQYLTCYVPYNFGNSHMLKMFHDQDFHNFVWRLFAETEIHKDYSVQIARNKGKNVVVTGFPGTDSILFNNKEASDIWKNKNTKKIIWAPHHTIDDDKSFISFSSFLQYQNFMFELLDLFNETIEIIFKPHPLLKNKLYNHPDWGKEKTDKYYQKWANHPFGNIQEGEYIELFLSSDAMIHDSGSFLIEYLYTGKPVLRTDRDDTICDRLNSFGKMAYQQHYIAKTKDEIFSFVKDVVILKNDNMKQKRINFKTEYLLPPNNKSASENIYQHLLSYLS